MGLFNKIFKKKEQVNDIVVSEPKENKYVKKETLENGKTVTLVFSPGLENGFPNKVHIVDSDDAYDISTVDGIKKIKEKPNQIIDIEGYDHSIEYYLQRKATEYKKAGNMDLAIACLKKSNSIMEINLAENNHHKEDFLRLPEFMKQAGLFNEARIEEEKICALFNKVHTYHVSFDRSQKYECVEVIRGFRICGDCAKYHDRIYSDNGEDDRFPDFCIFKNYIRQKQCSCSLTTYPFDPSISIMRGLGDSDPIKYSNRPFEDDRSDEEKLQYDTYIKQYVEEKKNRADYDWIRENLTDIAPKNFGGYVRMKNMQSQNYKKLVALAEEHGYIIN